MSSVVEKFSDWLISKSPRKTNFTLSQKNIYIFPTRAGFSFLALLLLMLLTAINYQNSLIYLILFFLGALFFLSIWACFLNLSGLTIETTEMGRCFENEQTQFHYRVQKTPNLPVALKIGENKAEARTISGFQSASQDLCLLAKSKRRGRHTIRRIYIESRFPFGLIVAWTWLKLDMHCLVYPSPVKGITDRQSEGEGEHQESSLTKTDPDMLKNYQAGDPVQRIVWKKYAAKDQLIIKDRANLFSSPKWVDWDNYDQATEERLRHLSFDVCRMSEEGKEFGLKLPNVIIPPGSGEKHRIRCLDALALYGY